MANGFDNSQGEDVENIRILLGKSVDGLILPDHCLLASRAGNVSTRIPVICLNL